jgi:hypothetical protein
MKILRSMNRRGFSVGPAGYFTVLKPNTWFPASRLADSFHHRSYQLGGTAVSATRNATAPSLAVKLNANDPGLTRLAVTVLGATAITATLLWWICIPR